MEIKASSFVANTSVMFIITFLRAIRKLWNIGTRNEGLMRVLYCLCVINAYIMALSETGISLDRVGLIPVCPSMKELDTWLPQFKAFVEFLELSNEQKLKIVKYAVSKIPDVVKLNGRSTYDSVME